MDANRDELMDANGDIGPGHEGGRVTPPKDDASPLDGLEPAGETALLLAVLADGCEQWKLIEAASTAMQNPVDVHALDRIAELRLAIVDAGWVRVARDDVRRAVLTRALPSQVQRAHLALAESSSDALSRGWHRTQAAPTPTREAAELALATARALQAAGRWAMAQVMLEQAARLAVDPGARAARLVEAGATAFAVGSPGHAQQLLDTAEDADPDAGSTLLIGLVRSIFSAAGPSVPLDRDQVEAAVNALHARALEPVAFSVLISTSGSSPSTSPARPAVPARLPTPADEALTALQDGNLPVAMRRLRTVSEELAAAGLRGVETQARALLAEISARTGNLSIASAQARQAQELAWVTRQRGWRTRAAVTEARVAALRGIAEAPRLVEAVHRTVLCDAGELGLLADLAYALSLTMGEEWGEALDLLLHLVDRTTEYPALLTSGLLGHIAEAALHAHRESEAREVLSRVADSSAGCERGSAHVDMMYAQALLATEAESDACFAVVQSLSPVDWPMIRARSDLAFGKLLRRRRRIREARTHLLSAHRLFKAISAPVWERRAEDELRASGRREPRSADRVNDRWAQLTPQEKAVVRLAAEGLTNREIGERLYLAPRTISAHLYHTFPKLGVTSRAQLARLNPGG